MKRLLLSLACLGCASVVYSAPIEFVGTIVADTTLNVPSDFATIQDALAYLSDKSIATEVNVTIKVADGTYTNNDTITIAHRDGQCISLIGNVTNPEACVLQFPDYKNGINVIKNSALGMLDGFTLVGGAGNLYESGILAQWGGFVLCGSNMVIESFYYSGLQAVFGGIIDARGVHVKNCTYGIMAKWNSYINAESANVTGCSAYGVYSVRSSSINVQTANSSTNLIGFFAQLGGILDAKSACASRNTHSGYYSDCLSLVNAQDATSSYHTNFGFRARNGSFIYAPGAVTTGNTTPYSPITNTEGNADAYISTTP